MNITNLSFSYGDKVIYKDFNLQLEDHKTTCIMGNSGGGKTTLLNCISGQLDYTGEIDYGQNSSQSTQKVAYVFQQPRLISSLTVMQNIRYVIEKSKRKDSQKRIEDLIRELNLEDCKDSYPSQISGGQASRVALARALAVDSQLLLLDEPFKGLDIKLKTYILQLLLPLIENKSVIFVTHDVEEALAMADRIVVLDRKNGQSVDIVKDIALDIPKNDRHLYSKDINAIRKEVYEGLLEN